MSAIAFNPRKVGPKIREIILIICAVLFIYPTVYVVINAFKTGPEIVSNPAGLPANPTLDNFATVLAKDIQRLQGKGIPGDISFFDAMANTIILCAGSVGGILLFASMAAYILVRRAGRMSNFLYLFFAFFIVIPFQVIMVPLVVMATDLQFKDHLGLILMYWGLGIPTAVFMFHGFIKSIPESLDESAAIDGAGPFRTFFTIVLPLMGPILTTIMILNTLWVWNDFLLPYIILRKGTLVLFQFNFFTTFTKNYGAMTASLVMTSTPVVILFLFLQRFIIKGVSAGAVKG